MKQCLDRVDVITTLGYSFSENHSGELIDKHLCYLFDKRKVRVVLSDRLKSYETCERLKKQGINAESTDFKGFDDFAKRCLIDGLDI